MTTPNPRAGEYRTLRIGETLKEGDECWMGEAWAKTRDAGTKVDAQCFQLDMRYRRFVVDKRPINWERLAKQMADARTIGAARKIYNSRGKK